MIKPWAMLMSNKMAIFYSLGPRRSLINLTWPYFQYMKFTLFSVVETWLNLGQFSMSNKTTAEVMVDNLFCIRKRQIFPCVSCCGQILFSLSFLVPSTKVFNMVSGFPRNVLFCQPDFGINYCASILTHHAWLSWLKLLFSQQ